MSTARGGNWEQWEQKQQTTTGADGKADADVAASVGRNGGESDPEKLAWDMLGITKPANGAISKRLAREAARVAIMPHMAEMIEAQVAQAKGLKYLVGRDATGKFRRIGPEELASGLFDHAEVWAKDPSTAAFTDLMNRAIDKPKEQEQEITINHSEELLARLDSWKVANRQAQLQLETPQDVVEEVVTLNGSDAFPKETP